MKCSILTTAGADPYYSATVLDAKRQGFEPVGFVSSGEPSKSEMNTNTRRALEWFLRTGDHHLLALDDDVCLGSGFRIAVERAMDLGFAAVTFGVFSKYLLGAVARRRALQGCLAMGFYPMANTKSKACWRFGRGIQCTSIAWPPVPRWRMKPAFTVWYQAQFGTCA